MKKLLIWGPAPFGSTGYCRLVGNLGPRLSKKYDLAYFSYSHIIGMPDLMWEGSPLISCTFDWLGQSRHFIVEAAKRFQPDVILQIFDLFTCWPVLKEANYKPVLEKLISYSPVDAIPCPEQIKECASLCKQVIPMCHFAKKTYEDAGIKCTETIYHGVDPSIYYPRDKAKMKEKFGLDTDTFLVLMVQDNTRRKNIPNQIQAFLNFRAATGARTHLQGIIPDMQEHREWQLEDLTRQLGIDDRCFSHTYDLPEETLAEIYSAADVLLQCPYSEGFGLPIIEAGACGTPTIATNFGSMTEILSDRDREHQGYRENKFFKAQRGWLVNGELMYYQPFLGSWQMIPSQDGITRALINAYEHPDSRKELGDEMKAWVAENCNWDKLAEKMANVVTAAD